MARARNIKPGFFESEQVGTASPGARLLFIALWQLADREGRMEERTMQIKAYAFRYDAITTEAVAGWLAELEAAKLIDRYESDGQKLIEILNFAKHQRPHQKEPQSVLAGKSSGEPEKVRALPPYMTPKPGNYPAQRPYMAPEPEKVRAQGPYMGVEPALNAECGMLNADVLKSAPPAPPRQPTFPAFDDGPDPEQLVGEAVEHVAKFWPNNGNVPLAKTAWKAAAASDVHGVAAWCEKAKRDAVIHAEAHEAKKRVDGRHFIPSLERWVREGDYARPAPKVIASANGKFQPMLPAAKPKCCEVCGGNGLVMKVPLAEALRMERESDAMGPCPECAV
jgi:hypothetical protein